MEKMELKNTVDISNFERITIPLIRRIYPRRIIDIFDTNMSNSHSAAPTPVDPIHDWKKEDLT